MSQVGMVVPQDVFDRWATALKLREPRALELAYALALALDDSDETKALRETTHAVRDANAFEIAQDVRTMLDEARARYDVLGRGSRRQVDLGNPAVPAFERSSDGERVLIVNNLTGVSQPVKFRDYAGMEGWDILNRVEFTFPARAQLEAYEFLWLWVG